MTIAIYVQLAVLALIDSTSIGTLLIPLWLLLRPDARRVIPRILLYLGVLASFYLIVGVAILSGVDWIENGLGAGSLMSLPAIQWVMVLGGGGMLAYALAANPKKQDAKTAAVAGGSGANITGSSTAADAGYVAALSPSAEKPIGLPPSDSPVVEVKWQKRLSKALGSPGGIIGLALVAGLLELPTMLPYLVAIGFLSNSTLPMAGEIAVLGVYCLIMLIPALLLLLLRVMVGSRLEPVLQRISGKLGKFTGETLLWVVGLVGFLLLRGGLSVLAPNAPWNPFK